MGHKESLVNKAQEKNNCAPQPPLLTTLSIKNFKTPTRKKNTLMVGKKKYSAG